MVPSHWLGVKRLDKYPAPQDVVLSLSRPRVLGPGLSRFQCILTQDAGYEFPRIPVVGSLVNRDILVQAASRIIVISRRNLFNKICCLALVASSRN